MRLLLLGPPGGGKGTQGRLLSQKFGVPHIATGVMLREEIASGTVFGKKIAVHLSKGKFAPDNEMIAWISQRLGRLDATHGYILDGFPRDIVQAQGFQVAGLECDLNAVVELQLGSAILQDRLLGRWLCPECERIYHDQYAKPIKSGICDDDGQGLKRRLDDSIEAIQTRLFIYEKVTLPLRSYYQKKSLLISIKAHDTVHGVQESILQALESSKNKSARLEV